MRLPNCHGVSCVRCERRFGDQLDAEAFERIMSHLHFCNGMNVENIQNQVEAALQ